MPSFEIGESIPVDTAHAVSVSLPTWKSNVGYEEGEDWVVNRMTTGYPRFFIHRSIDAFATDIVSQHGLRGQHALLMPTPRIARRCCDFIRERTSPAVSGHVRILDLALDPSREVSDLLSRLAPTISAVVYPDEVRSVGKEYWQHTGDGISSRRAEFCHGLFKEKLLALVTSESSLDGTSDMPKKSLRGPKRYQRPDSISEASATLLKAAPPPGNTSDESHESNRFLEERYGRNLDLSLVGKARSAIRRRIAGAVAGDIDKSETDVGDVHPNTRGLNNLREDDVFLYPAGMNAIFNAHRALLIARPPNKSISFGFPYVDTLKILQKFGPGCVFYGNGSDEDLDDLEKRLESGETFLALFCEFPGNPLLKCYDLSRIRRLADQYDFAVVIDETIGTFANINVLQVADVVVSSLTKIFSGDSNVMGGSAILNPEGRYYTSLKKAMQDDYEDTYWPEDVVFMERNSRDFLTRVTRVNSNAEAICAVLQPHPLVKSILYPKHNSTRSYYDIYRLPHGGYGGLLSIVFHRKSHAQAFFDALGTDKGPSLGTNFTLCSPYVLLAHYQELPWAAQFGVDPDLIRVSVGLESSSGLQETFRKALAAAESASLGSAGDSPVPPGPSEASFAGRTSAAALA